MKFKPTQLPTLGFQIAAAYSAVKRLRQARATGDRLDLADAVANLLVFATSTALLVRSLRKGTEA